MDDKITLNKDAQALIKLLRRQEKWPDAVTDTEIVSRVLQERVSANVDAKTKIRNVFRNCME